MPDKDLQLSIILPIYNVEPYLEKCIRSLEDQDIPKDSYEIICVNDGSPDGCLQIIKDLQKEFSNIVLIDQVNQGVSMARNNGIKASKGAFIMFVDPDDSVEKNSLGDLLNFIRQNKLEVAYSPITFVEINGEKKPTFFENKQRESERTEGVELYFLIRGKKITDPDRIYGILFKRDLIIDNKLFYLKGVPFLEDGEFLSRILCLAVYTGIYNVPYYLRLNRPGSATTTDLVLRRKSIKGFLDSAINLKTFQKNKDLTLRQKTFMNQPIVKFVLLAVRSAIASKSMKNFFYVKKELEKNDLIKLELEGCLDKFVEMGKIYNRSIFVFYFYWMKESLKRKVFDKK